MPCLLTVLFCTWKSASQRQRSWSSNLCVRQLWHFHATTIPLRRLLLSSTWAFSFSLVGCCWAIDQPNQVKGRWFLGCCPATTFFATVRQDHQLALTFIAGCLGACLAVWVSSVGHAQPACCCCYPCSFGLAALV